MVSELLELIGVSFLRVELKFELELPLSQNKSRAMVNPFGT